MSRREQALQLKKWDFLVFGAVALLFVGSLLWTFFYVTGAKEGGSIRVSADGKPDAVYSLAEEQLIVVETESHMNEIQIRDGAADVTYADCPDQYCVKHKPIAKEGETIVCLPHKMVITVEGGEAWELDDVAN